MTIEKLKSAHSTSSLLQCILSNFLHATGEVKLFVWNMIIDNMLP